MKQRFNTFAEMSRHKKEGEDYKIAMRSREKSKVAIVAPHGGCIEFHTDEMAEKIAGKKHNLYVFEAIAQDNAFYELHVTSTGFDEKRCVDMVAKSGVTLTIHGCKGEEPAVYIGGRDKKMKGSLAKAFNKAGVKAETQGHPFTGASPQNICNRNKRGEGVQLEFSRALRDDPSLRSKCVKIIRKYLKKHGYG